MHVDLSPLEEDSTHYEDPSFVLPSTAPTFPVLQCCDDLSPKSPSRSPTPTPDDANYPCFPQYMHIADFYWPDAFGTCFEDFRTTLANYPVCLFQRNGEDDLTYKERMLETRRFMDKSFFKSEMSWRSAFRSKGYSRLESERQLGIYVSQIFTLFPY